MVVFWCFIICRINKRNYCDLVADLEKVQSVLAELKHLSRTACETLDCRIEAVLERMSSVELCVLPVDEPVTIDEFLHAAETSCAEAAAALAQLVVFIYTDHFILDLF